jgi:hypothetical protein
MGLAWTRPSAAAHVCTAGSRADPPRSFGPPGRSRCHRRRTPGRCHGRTLRTWRRPRAQSPRTRRRQPRSTSDRCVCSATGSARTGPGSAGTLPRAPQATRCRSFRWRGWCPPHSQRGTARCHCTSRRGPHRDCMAARGARGATRGTWLPLEVASAVGAEAGARTHHACATSAEAAATAARHSALGTRAAAPAWWLTRSRCRARRPSATSPTGAARPVGPRRCRPTP